MKKCLKKLLAAFTVVSIIATICNISFVGAVSDDSITQQDIQKAFQTEAADMWHALQDSPETLGFTPEEVQNAYIGSSFTIVNREDGVTETVDDILYFPVISDGDIIALLTLIKFDGMISCSIGKDFAPELSEYLEDAEGNSALFSENGSIYAISPASEISGIFHNEEASSAARRSTADDVSYEDIKREDNVVSAVELTEETYRFPNAVSSRAASSYKYLTDFPIVFQGNFNICWAATAAAIIIFEMPEVGNLYATTLCDQIGHPYNEGTANDAIRAMELYFPSTHILKWYNHAMTPNDVQVIINNIDPAYMHSNDVNGGLGHVTALCGYAWYGSTFQIRFMEPDYACFRFSTYTNGNYRYTKGNRQYQWSETVRILYRV